MKLWQLPFKNLTRRPGRTIALSLLTALLAFSVFAGSVLVNSLRSGLASLEGRLGADIILLPSSAQSKISFEKLFLQGTTGAFYMEDDVLTEALNTSGVAKASAQTFLASLKADCCSVKIQVIGIDPETDFTVQPWIARSTKALGEMEVAVGCKVEVDVGDTLRIYDQPCAVVARLDATGTGLDTAVYCTMDTMRVLLAAAEEKGITHKITSDDENVISAVYIKAKDGTDIDALNTYLNSHIRKVTAVRTRSMITDVSDSLTGITRMIGIVIIAIWVLAVVILLIAYAMMTRERRREFAVLRLLGTSRRTLCRVLLTECGMCGLIGALAGTALAACLVFPFTALIETSLGLPYLMPGVGEIIGYACMAVAAAALVSALSSAWAVWRLSQSDAGAVLREGS